MKCCKHFWLFVGSSQIIAQYYQLIRLGFEVSVLKINIYPSFSVIDL